MSVPIPFGPPRFGPGSFRAQAFQAGTFQAGAFQGGQSSVVVAKAIVVLGDKTPEGHLIHTVAPAWFEILALIEKDPDALFKIPPRKLEELIAAAYVRNGFDRVTLTPPSGDYGRDVIAEKTGWGSIRFVDQVKAYKPGHVTRCPAREIRSIGCRKRLVNRPKSTRAKACKSCSEGHLHVGPIN